MRRHHGKHCSMLINVSRFVEIQKTVRTYVNVYLKSLKEAVKANYAMPEQVSDKNRYMLQLKTVFENSYSDCNVTWSKVKTELFNAVNSIRTFVVNSKSDESLNYKQYEKDGTGLTAIAIGGLSYPGG